MQRYNRTAQHRSNGVGEISAGRISVWDRIIAADRARNRREYGISLVSGLGHW